MTRCAAAMRAGRSGKNSAISTGNCEPRAGRRDPRLVLAARLLGQAQPGALLGRQQRQRRGHDVGHHARALRAAGDQHAQPTVGLLGIGRLGRLEHGRAHGIAGVARLCPSRGVDALEVGKAGRDQRHARRRGTGWRGPSPRSARAGCWGCREATPRPAAARWDSRRSRRPREGFSRRSNDKRADDAAPERDGGERLARQPGAGRWSPRESDGSRGRENRRRISARDRRWRDRPTTPRSASAAASDGGGKQMAARCRPPPEARREARSRLPRRARIMGDHEIPARQARPESPCRARARAATSRRRR